MTALVTPSPEGPPERIGRYEVLLQIGSGGMATVYLARAEVMTGLYRDVALKMMHPQLSSGSGEAAVVLLEEARLTASIRHPNVVTVHEAAEDARGVYMVMDYVEGDSLTGLIRGANDRDELVPAPVIARILCDALAGLHAAHELRDATGRPLNVVHRDYSPSNILVGVDGITRLADFGVAKAESRVSATTTGTIKGKLGYMAPEQVLAKKLDRRCDVWAAGVVVWECLAGERLYGADMDPVALLFRMVHEEPPRLRSVRPDLPAAVDEAIASALTADLDRRCPTAAELRRRLLEAWRAIGPVAEPSEVGEYVAALAGANLKKRREKIARVLELRSKRARAPQPPLTAGPPSPPPVESATAPETPLAMLGPPRSPLSDLVRTLLLPPSPGTFEAPQTAALAPVTEATTEVWTRSASRSRRAVALGAAALGVAIAAGIAASTAPAPSDSASTERASSASASTERPAPASSAAAPAPSAPLAASAASPGAASASAAREAAVIVRANADIASLRVGERAILMARPARQVEVRLAAAEQTAALPIDAVSLDGRRASAQIAPGSAAITLVFPAAPRRASPPRPPGPAPGAPPPLAPSPFGNR